MKRIVILDPGHRKDTPGKRGNGLLEYEFNEDVTNRAKKRFKELAPDIDVYVTITTENHRSSEYTAAGRRSNLLDRSRFINNIYRDAKKKYGENGFKIMTYSIHANAANTPKANGYEIFCWKFGGESHELAKIHQSFARDMLGVGTPSYPDRGVKSANFSILSNSYGPAALIEHEFYSSEIGANRLKSSNYRDRCADAIVYSAAKFVGATIVDKEINEIIQIDDLYRVRKEWINSGSQLGAYRSLDTAIKIAKESGYKVFDSVGNLIYPVNKGHWAEEYYTILNEKGYVTTREFDKQITIGEFYKIVDVITGEIPNNMKPSTQSKHWADIHYRNLLVKGLVEEDVEFLDAHILRGDAFRLLDYISEKTIVKKEVREHFESLIIKGVDLNEERFGDCMKRGEAFKTIAETLPIVKYKLDIKEEPKPVEPPPVKPQEPSKTIKYLDYKRTITGYTKGEDIRQVQVALSILGHDPKGVDASYGPGCQNAVKTFKKSVGLPDNNVIDSTVIAAINKALSNPVNRKVRSVGYKTSSTMNVIQTFPDNIYTAILGKTLHGFGVYGINGTFFDTPKPALKESCWALCLNGGKPLGPNAGLVSYDKTIKRGTVFSQGDSVGYKIVNNMNELPKPITWAISGFSVYPTNRLIAEKVNQGIDYNTKHTYIGIKNNMVYLMVDSASHRPVHREKMFSEMGLEYVVLLDGGGSSQINHPDVKVTSSRAINSAVLIKQI